METQGGIFRLSLKLVFNRISVFASKCKFNIKIAACYLNAEVKHIGICKNYFGYVARCFVNGALNFAVNPVYLYRLKCQMRGVILPADRLICRYVPVI